MAAALLAEGVPELEPPWSDFRCFHLVDGLQEADKTLLIAPRPVNVAIDELNSGTITCPSGICVVFSESQEGYFVLFRHEQQAEALARFWKTCNVGLAAKLVATKAVVSKTMCILPGLARLYRFTEFNAQVIFLCLMTWVVNPWILACYFVIFWYLPAVRQTGSYGKPIGYPALNFCVDGFSCLSLHPQLSLHAHPVTPWRAYRYAMIRIVGLLALAPFLIPATSPLPDSVLHVLSNKGTLDRISWLNHRAERSGDLAIYSEDLWKVVSGIIVALTILWLAIVLPMVVLEKCARRLGGVGETEDAAASLAVQVAYAASKAPEDCRAELERLRSEAWPTLKLTSAGNTVGPAWAVLLHIGIDVLNISSFAKAGDTARAALLSLVVLITMCYANNVTTGGIMSICRETRLSWSRGLFTDDYLAFVKADKGIQSIPSLIIILSGLPFKAKNFMATLGGMGSIIINVALVVPFIYEQFDLGLEKEGRSRDEEPQLEAQC